MRRDGRAGRTDRCRRGFQRRSSRLTAHSAWTSRLGTSMRRPARGRDGMGLAAPLRPPLCSAGKKIGKRRAASRRNGSEHRMENGSRVTEEEALQFHSQGRPGKIEISATKPLTTQRDLSLAYSPGVAFPCLHIQRDPALAYDLTAKGNMVAVFSNGTAVAGPWGLWSPSANT